MKKKEGEKKFTKCPRCKNGTLLPEWWIKEHGAIIEIFCINCGYRVEEFFDESTINDGGEKI